MPASLFIEHCANGFAFYINGELQFHTEDEQIYHEYLVVPAIAIAGQRFLAAPNSEHRGIRVLICGGGDGLAAREVLRFAEVSRVDVVDYNPDVLELGRTVFAPFNHGSLTNPKVKVYAQDAFAFLAENILSPSDRYHVVICDFTYPTTADETRVHSREWFQLVHQSLHPQGIVAANAVSPDRNTAGFWCLYQTLWSAGLMTKPLHIHIPSFAQHDYGNWGFFFATRDRPITKAELTSMHLPNDLRSLTLDSLLSTFSFPEAITAQRFDVNIHSLQAPQLLYYLLNPHALDLAITTTVAITVDFLALDEAQEIEQISRTWMRSLVPDPMQLESIAKKWLEQLNTSHPDFQQLLPVQHPHHTPPMTSAWLGAMQQLLGQIDLPRLIRHIIIRGQNLSPQIIHDLQQLLAKLQSSEEFPRDRHRQDSASLPPRPSMQSQPEPTPLFASTSAKFIIAMSVTMLLANVVAPDSVFAKGSYGSSGSGSGDDYWSWGVTGIIVTFIGISWLSALYSDKNSN